MILVYYIFFALVLCLIGPFLLVNSKARTGLDQKLGRIPQDLIDARAEIQGAMWLHAVSVGEFNAILPLVQALHQKYPRLPLVVSTTTRTGQTLAKQKLAGIARTFYFPFDLPFAIANWLDFVGPSAVVIAETEIWPGFVDMARANGIPLAVVNGRMSPKSFKGYERWKFFFGPVLRRFSVIGVQSEDERSRYRAVGGTTLPVVVLGNLKYDGLVPIAPEKISALQESLGITDDTVVIVAGSTHPGEESAMLDAYSRALASPQGQNGKILLVLVPRHPERFDQVADLISQRGFALRRFSRGENVAGADKPVFLLDTIGKLLEFYALADVAFVGGTIAPIGGHNIMEPYAFGVPVLIGPRYEKTRDSAKALLAKDAIVVCESTEDLSREMLKLLADPELRKTRGESGLKILQDSQGAVQNALDMLAPFIAKSMQDV